MQTLNTEIEKLKELKTEGSRKKLIHLLRERLAANNNDTSAWYDLACCYDSLGCEKEAEPCYAQVYKRWRTLPKKERPGFFVGFGSTLRNNIKLARSEAVLKEGVRHFPDYLALKVFLALTFYTGKKFKSSALVLFKSRPGPSASAFDGYERAINHYIKALK